MKSILALGLSLLLAATSLAAPPANDSFANRQVVTGLVNILNINNIIEATTEGGEPMTDTDVPYSLWYEWTAPDDGKVQLDSINTPYGMVIDVFFGNTLNTLQFITNDFDFPSIVTLPVTKGSAYIIRCRGQRWNNSLGTKVAHAGDVGHLGINLRTDTQYNGVPLQRPSTVNNDLFVNRVKLSGSSVTVIGYNAFATNENGEPNSSTGTKTLWWEWTAPADGTFSLQRSAESNANVLCIFTGSQIGSLTLVGRTTSTAAGRGSILAGETIQISMGGNSPGTAIFGLNFTPNANAHYWQSNTLTTNGNAAIGKRTGVAHGSWAMYFYKGTDGNIWCVYYGGGTSWTQAQLTTAANVDDWLTVAPTYNLLCYRGADGNLYAVYPSNGIWVTAKLSNQTANVAGDLAVDPVNNYIYYRGTDNGLWIVYVKNGVWTQLSLSATYGFSAAVAGDLTVDAGSHLVYYRGTDSQMYATYLSGATWRQAMLTNTPNVGGALTADSGYLVYYRSNTDNTPWACYLNGGVWTQVRMDATATISTATSVGSLYGHYTLMYLDANQQCSVEYLAGSTWVHRVLGDGGSNLVGGLSMQYGSNWCFAQRGDGHVILFVYR